MNRINFKFFGFFVTIVALSFFFLQSDVISSSQQIHQKAELKDLYPLVESYKAKADATAFLHHKIDYTMDGTMYFKKPNMFRTELKWSSHGDTSDFIETSDGTYKWDYYETFKVAIREDISAQKNELKKMYGFLPLYTTNDNITYLGKEKFKGELVKKYVVIPSQRLKKIEPKIDVKREFLVGDKDGIVRGVNFYDENGNLTFVEEFTVISTNENFNDELFTVQPGEDVHVQYK